MTEPLDRTRICAYYIAALKSGEAAPAKRIAPYIAEKAVSHWKDLTVTGRDEVLARVTGKWPMTRYLTKGGYSEAVEEDGHYVVVAEYPSYVNQTVVTKVIFDFDAEDKISEVTHEIRNRAPVEKLSEVPLEIRGLVNNALANETPMVIAHVNPDGDPELSLRGSFQFYGPKHISLWLRSPEGGLGTAIKTHPNVSLLYRDQLRNATVIIKGRAYIETDETIRQTVYDLSPEVEQQHLPDRSGVCMMIELTRVQAMVGPRTMIIEP